MIELNKTNNINSLAGEPRLQNDIKQFHSSSPLVTIITATFNAADHLHRTIQSIRGLTYKNIEWIVIDGNSTDQTIELIKRNEDIVDYWVSEPDGGIYDAWNKGVSMARGEWIAFLGAGDTYKPESITAYIEAIKASSVAPDLVSSRVQLVDSDGVVLREWGGLFNWDVFRKYMNIAHVGSLHHRRLFENFGHFDTAYKSSADYDFLMRGGAELKALYIDQVTALMLGGGASNGYKGIYETYLIQRRFGAGASAKVRYWIACVKRFIRPACRGY